MSGKIGFLQTMYSEEGKREHYFKKLNSREGKRQRYLVVQ